MRASKPVRQALAACFAVALAVAVAAASPGFAPSGVVAQDEEHAQLYAYIDQDQISGSGFGGPVTVTITDLTVTPNTSATYPWDRIEDDGQGGFHLFLDGSEQTSPWDLRHGNLVEVVGPTETRTLVVADLRITGFDLEANTLTGTSDTTGTVYLRAAHGQTEAFTIAPVLDGAWSADYDDAIPPYDPRVMDSAEASQPDTDGDLTITRLSVLAPARFGFGPELQQVIGYGWPDGATITLTVDRPGTPISPDLTSTAIADSTHGSGTVINTGEGNVAFSLAGGPFLVLPGDVLAMSDGTTTKTQVIPDLRVLLPDYDVAVLSGATSVPLPAGSFLMVGQDAYSNGGGATHEVAPAVDGTWSQSFAGDPGGLGTVSATWPWANQVDGDGDSTGVNAPVPQAYVDPVRDRVWALDLTHGPVTLTVTRDGALVDAITVEATTVYHENCGLYDMWTQPTSTLDRPTTALFDLAGRLDILPGDLLAVSDGTTLLEITADLLTVDDGNPLTDIMSGSADGPVGLKLGDTCGGYSGFGTTPVDGAWSYWFDPTQFAVPLNGLSGGDVVWVSVGGATRVRWVVGPGPAFGGFLAPVDSRPVLNTMKAGKAVEVRFSLGGDFGLGIFAEGSPASLRIPPVAATMDAIEKTVNAKAAGLHYDAVTGQYVYTWVTSKAWAGTYRQLVLTLADGSTFRADFLLTK